LGTTIGMESAHLGKKPSNGRGKAKSIAATVHLPSLFSKIFGINLNSSNYLAAVSSETGDTDRRLVWILKIPGHLVY
jgi:hypothetical protein